MAEIQVGVSLNILILIQEIGESQYLSYFNILLRKQGSFDISTRGRDAHTIYAS